MAINKKIKYLAPLDVEKVFINTDIVAEYIRDINLSKSVLKYDNKWSLYEFRNSHTGHKITEREELAKIHKAILEAYPKCFVHDFYIKQQYAPENFSPYIGVSTK